MKKMLNRMVSMSFVLMLLCSFATIHAAVPDEGIMPMYTYISDAGCAMEINGSRAVMNAYVYGDFDKAQIKMTLQILDGATWRNVTSWAITEETDTLSLDKGYNIDPNESYRIKATIKIWRGTATETASCSATP